KSFGDDGDPSGSILIPIVTGEDQSQSFVADGSLARYANQTNSAASSACPSTCAMSASIAHA
ncbi:MAG TPA: hypothetical protein VHX39_24615, partial [Acetobacteraceae bacterium]|nr:hypothetical protein [Acetobacteraceae bacterium]